MSNAQELLPCPFCGGKAESPDGSSYASCSGKVRQHCIGRTVEGNVIDWNTRTPSTPAVDSQPTEVWNLANDIASKIYERRVYLRSVHKTPIVAIGEMAAIIEKEILDSQPVGQEDSGLASFIDAALWDTGLSPSGSAWQEWFGRMGDRATVDVVNATANLVIAEREIRSRNTSVSPQPKDGWMTFGRIKVDIESETETFERMSPPVPSVSPSEALESKDWLCSGGNGVITLFEMGNSMPIAYFRPGEQGNVEAVIEAHNAALRSARAPVASVEELAELRAWKQSATKLLLGYDQVAESFGGELGSSKVDNLAEGVNSLRAQLAAKSQPVPVDDERVKEIRGRLIRVPDEWIISKHLATFSLNHIKSTQPVEDYWRKYDEHLAFIKHAAADMRYVLAERDAARNLLSKHLDGVIEGVFGLAARPDVWDALKESVKLQSHYAKLLNMWDGGERLQFADADEWLARLAALEAARDAQEPQSKPEVNS